MKEKETLVSSVLPGSIAEEAGIENGDWIISINNEKIGDIFDYRFLMANEELVIEVQKQDGSLWEIEVEKDEYEDLGVEFESSMLDEAKSCTNKCIFCFIDQLPRGMRETMYFKDDDSRLSFLTGNYVTLTNMRDDDIHRIVKYKMTPINVSVHTTNPDLRVFMLKNRFAGNVMKQIEKLIAGGITVNCQIVLCREVNDRHELDSTIENLTGLYPGVQSVSVVPVGITKHREGLCPLKAYDAEAALEVVGQVSQWQEKLLREYGSRIVYLADEFYLLANVRMPDSKEYEGFPQIENGVGLTALLQCEFEEYLEQLEVVPIPRRSVSIATGVSSFPHIKQLADVLQEKYDVKVDVYEIKNNFFGENVTVTGLLTGQDLEAQLKGKDLGQELLLCRCMLKAGEVLFLDDYTVDGLAHNLDIKISIVENDGRDFIQSILGIKE